jgi:hypothetical protein
MHAIIGYLCSVAFVLVYTTVWDGRNGIFLLTALITAPILSVFMTLIAKRKIVMSVHSSAHVLKKGDQVNITATFQKSGIFPAPFLEVWFFHTTNLEASHSVVTFSMNAGKPVNIGESYTARVWGTTQIGIEKVVMSDYLGLVKFVLYQDQGSHRHANEVEIYPDIPDASVQNELIRSICDRAAFGDDDPEETAVNIYGISSFPGYEHKVYMPGDPVKKINWKLSSKRNTLLMRLDESVVKSKQVMILDCCTSRMDLRTPKEKEQQFMMEERILETVLAVLAILVKLGVESVLYYYSGKMWTQAEIADSDDIINLQYIFTKYKFQPRTPRYEHTRVASQKFGNIGAITVFTSSYDAGLLCQVQNIRQQGTTVSIVVTLSPAPSMSRENVWLVSETYDITGC